MRRHTMKQPSGPATRASPIPAISARLTVPTYSHEAYDVAGTRTFDRPDILIFNRRLAFSEDSEPLTSIVVVSAGRIVESGSMDELSSRRSLFAHLFKLDSTSAADEVRTHAADRLRASARRR